MPSPQSFFKSPKPKDQYKQLHKSKQRREEWKGDRQALRTIEAKDKDQRAYQKAMEAKQYRHAQAIAKSKPLAKLSKILIREYPNAKAYSRRDVDLDLGDLVSGLFTRADPWNDRVVAFELAMDFCKSLAKDQRKYSLDDPGPLFVVRAPETMDDVKAALGFT